MNTVTHNVADHAGIDDWKYDPWGCALSLHFAICDVLDAIGGYEYVLARWDYHRGAVQPSTLQGLAALDDGDPAAYLAESVIDGSLTVESLIHAGDVLERFESLLKLNGRDY